MSWWSSELCTTLVLNVLSAMVCVVLSPSHGALAGEREFDIDPTDIGGGMVTAVSQFAVVASTR